MQMQTLLYGVLKMKNKILLMSILILMNIGFVFAYTAPTYNNIAQRLCTGYTPPYYYNIDSQLSPCVIDTCTAPLINNNWNILWRDNCTIPGCDLGSGNLTGYGASGGYLTLTADCYVSNFYETMPTGGPMSGITVNRQRIRIR
jgi:hypothetical protein